MLENLEEIHDGTYNVPNHVDTEHMHALVSTAIDEDMWKAKPSRRLFAKVETVSTISHDILRLGEADQHIGGRPPIPRFSTGVPWALLPAVTDVRCTLERLEAVVPVSMYPKMPALAVWILLNWNDPKLLRFLSESESLTRFSCVNVIFPLTDPPQDWEAFLTELGKRRHALTHLELIAQSTYPHPRQRIDLARFESLRHLSISMRLIISVDEETVGVTPLLPDHLPASLVTLELWHCFFSRRGSQKPSRQEVNFEKNLPGFILAVEAGSFPNFRHLCV